MHVQHKATHMTIICSKCRNTKVITCKPGLGGAQFPRYCDANAEAELGADNCGQDPYVVLPHKSKFSDLQTLKLQVRVLSCLMCLHTSLSYRNAQYRQRTARTIALARNPECPAG